MYQLKKQDDIEVTASCSSILYYGVLGTSQCVSSGSNLLLQWDLREGLFVASVSVASVNNECEQYIFSRKLCLNNLTSKFDPVVPVIENELQKCHK